MELETKRLTMRNWRQSDFDVYASYYADKETAQFVGGQMSRAKAWRHMAAVAGHWVLKGFGLWAVAEKGKEELIGCIGLWEPEGWPELEVGYWLLNSAQGNGYATEAALRARQYAFEQLGAKTLVSYIDPRNAPSISVAERMGAWHDETIQLLDLGAHCVYRHPHPEGQGM